MELHRNPDRGQGRQRRALQIIDLNLNSQYHNQQKGKRHFAFFPFVRRARYATGRGKRIENAFADVRFTTYDVRFGEFPRGAREVGEAGAGVEMWSDVRGWLESGDGA